MIGSLPQTLHSLEPQKMEKMDPMSNQQCRVCSEPAAGFHFGAFTCEGCKSFFGRTCNNQSVIQECKNSYRCVVDKKNRTACKACRLRKCLMVGMSKSGSRYGRRSNWFKIHCLMQNQSSTSSHEPPSKTPHQRWPPASEGSVGETRDSSFGSTSRSPSPLNTSLESLRKASPSSHTESPFSPTLTSPPDMDHHSSPPFPPSPLSSLYSSPLSNPLLGAFSPFYKLSPLLASSPLLAPHLLLQLQGQRSHLDALTEQRQLLDKLRLQQQLTTLGLPMGAEGMEEEDRPVSPPHSTDAPIDLSVKISAAPLLLLPPSPTPSVSPRIEVSTPDKPDANQNLLGSSALDLTVSS